MLKGEKPTATLGKLATIIIDNYNELPNTKTILKIAKTNAFWSKYTDETIITTFNNDKFKSYIIETYKSKNKTIITQKD